VKEMKAASRAARVQGKRIGFVPTMGFLHEGHLALMRTAREISDWVVVSVFVNPTQFGPQEDLARYPRAMERDSDLCRKVGVAVLFAPTAEEIYPRGFQTYVTVEDLSKPLCGASRPGHFRGVATVVAKLFQIVAPDVAVFGEKDYQQLQVIRRMVRDLDMDVEIVGVPTVREADGLAMSSRNTYLSPQERQRALCISRALARAQTLVSAGVTSAGAVVAEVEAILRDAGAQIDYAELRHPETLEPVEEIDSRTLLAVAARIGATRLIDNRILAGPSGETERR
jgi:pantoate--beta-alanine ligase